MENRDLMKVEPDLRLLDLPVLIIRREADFYFSEVIAEWLHREIPINRVESIPTTRHFIQEDKPDKLVVIISQFFEEANYDG